MDNCSVCDELLEDGLCHNGSCSVAVCSDHPTVYLHDGCHFCGPSNNPWAFYDDIVSSFALAMQGKHIPDSVIGSIMDTVDDYVSNTYGE